MEFVTDPPIAVKIQKMQQRIRWQDPAIVERGIDQTELVIDDGEADDPEFSFLAIGDSGSGSHRSHSPQRKIAEMMLGQMQDCRFVLHTGDVVYLVGAQEQYYKNFIEPYQEFLVGGERPRKIAFDQMTFKLPFLTVLGNHDYYDLPLVYGLLAQSTLPIRYLLRSKIDFDIGLRGSQQGKVYAQAFLDYLLRFKTPAELAQHLDQHYSAQGTVGKCLRYQPKAFTRQPNRYYQFRYSGIDFFALDSNTFNGPIPLSGGEAGDAQRRILEQRRAKVQQEQAQLFEQSMQLDPDSPDEAEQLDDCRTKLEQLEEVEKDITKQLQAGHSEAVDTDQLSWFSQRLIESWNTEAVRGRVSLLSPPTLCHRSYQVASGPNARRASTPALSARSSGGRRVGNRQQTCGGSGAQRPCALSSSIYKRATQAAAMLTPTGWSAAAVAIACGGSAPKALSNLGSWTRWPADRVDCQFAAVCWAQRPRQLQSVGPTHFCGLMCRRAVRPGLW